MCNPQRNPQTKASGRDFRNCFIHHPPPPQFTDGETGQREDMVPQFARTDFKRNGFPLTGKLIHMTGAGKGSIWIPREAFAYIVK